MIKYEEEDALHKALQRSDKALFVSKEHGRNQVNFL